MTTTDIDKAAAAIAARHFIITCATTEDAQAADDALNALIDACHGGYGTAFTCMAYIARRYAYGHAQQAALANAALARLDFDDVVSAVEQALNQEFEFLEDSAELFMKYDLADAINAEAQKLSSADRQSGGDRS